MGAIRPSGDERAREKMAARVTGSAFVWLALFIFGLAVLLWISGSGMADLMWTRYIYLLTGVETVAFAALGWLFGREVHRQQAESAMKQADQARKDTMDVVDKAMGAMGQAMGQADQARKEAMGMVSEIMDTKRQATDAKPQTISEIEDNYERAKALSALGTALAQAGQLELAQNVILSIEDNYERAKALSALGTALAQAGQLELANAIWKEALDSISSGKQKH
jgi:tetratricopeptide (TPR) repeat protein